MCGKTFNYKKVLLRERKRHTARRVASTRYAALSGGGTQGTPPSTPGQGVPHQDLVGEGYLGYPPPSRPGQGYPGYLPPSRPGQGVPHPDLVAGWGVPWVPPPSRPGWGYLSYPPPSRPCWGTPGTPHHPDL